MNDRHRFAVAGALVGAVLGAYFVSVQYGADVQGRRILGVVEFMSLASLPLSVVSWLVVLALAALATLAGVPPEAETPRWVAYLWLTLTPVLNWAFLGWLAGALRDRRRLLRPPVEPAA